MLISQFKSNFNQKSIEIKVLDRKDFSKTNYKMNRSHLQTTVFLPYVIINVRGKL